VQSGDVPELVESLDPLDDLRPPLRKQASQGQPFAASEAESVNGAGILLELRSMADRNFSAYPVGSAVRL